MNRPQSAELASRLAFSLPIPNLQWKAYCGTDSYGCVCEDPFSCLIGLIRQSWVLALYMPLPPHDNVRGPRSITSGAYPVPKAESRRRGGHFLPKSEGTHAPGKRTLVRTPYLYLSRSFPLDCLLTSLISLTLFSSLLFGRSCLLLP